MRACSVRCINMPPCISLYRWPGDDVTTSRDRYMSALINGGGPHVLSQGVSEWWRSAGGGHRCRWRQIGLAELLRQIVIVIISRVAAAAERLEEKFMRRYLLEWYGGPIWFRGCGYGKASRCGSWRCVRSTSRNVRRRVYRLESAYLDVELHLRDRIRLERLVITKEADHWSGVCVKAKHPASPLNLDQLAAVRRKD